jgi:adenylate cyclase
LVEIERKFLVVSLEGCLEKSTEKIKMVQGYLSFDPARTVRVRITDTQAFITIKGKSNKKGDTRLEWEKQIAVKEAQHLLTLCVGSQIKKTRHLVPHQSHVFEIDVFEGDHTGLVIAEVELSSSEEHVDLPHWIGKEVTGDSRYYNSSLAQKLD